jgi:hypothetical protein
MILESLPYFLDNVYSSKTMFLLIPNFMLVMDFLHIRVFLKVFGIIIKFGFSLFLEAFFK